MAAKDLTTVNTTNYPHIGVFGGTFDPIHIGHIEPTKDAAKQLNLTQIRLMPAHIPPHKQGTYASTKQRIDMVELVCNVEPLFIADKRETERDKPSYTVDSLAQLKQQQPNAKIFFFIGTDSLLTLHTWHQIEQIFELCHIVVTTRPGYKLSDGIAPAISRRITTNISDVIENQVGQILLLNTCQFDVSSTQIRQAVRQDQDWHSYVHKNIEQYIKSEKLYR